MPRTVRTRWNALGENTPRDSLFAVGMEANNDPVTADAQAPVTGQVTFQRS